MIVKCHACQQSTKVNLSSTGRTPRYDSHNGGVNNGEPFRCIQSGMLVPVDSPVFTAVLNQVARLAFGGPGDGSLPVDSYGGTGNKYHRVIHGLRMHHPDGASVTIDVYSVIVAFKVESPGLQHCAKKVLCGGLRDKGTYLNDLYEARDALARAIEDAERDNPTQARKPCPTDPTNAT